MKPKILQLFTFTAGVALLLTALAKFISASGNAHLLKASDPSLGIQYDHLFLLVGTCELFVAVVCLFTSQTLLKAILIAWLATMFLIYRFSLLWIHWAKPCPCMGTLTGALHIQPKTADTIMQTVLAYLLIGSYGTLLWYWRQQKRSFAPAPEQ